MAVDRPDGRGPRRLTAPAGGGPSASTAAGFDELADDLMRPDVARAPPPGPPGPLRAAARSCRRRSRPGGGAPTRPGPCSAAWPPTPSVPCTGPTSSAIGRTIIAAGHRHGWPVAEGGSRSITDALAAMLADLGGKIRTGVHVRPRPRHPIRRRRPARPGPRRHRRHLRRPPPGRGRPRLPPVPPRPGRVQGRPGHRRRRAVDQPGLRPGRDRPPRRHLRGDRRHRTRHRQGAHARAAVRPRRPAVPGRPDPVGRQHPPAVDLRPRPPRLHRRRHRGHPRPDRAVRPRASGTASSPERSGRRAQLPAYNPNYVGGDVVTGANTGRQLLLRPRVAVDPYCTGIPGTYICSAASPPGAGAHGMCGFHAAGSALRHLRIPPD